MGNAETDSRIKNNIVLTKYKGDSAGKEWSLSQMVLEQLRIHNSKNELYHAEKMNSLVDSGCSTSVIYYCLCCVMAAVP